MPEEPTLGEIGRTVLRVEGDVRELRAESKDRASIFVTRAEYDERKSAIDRVISGVESRIEAGFAELKAQRAPWWVLLSSGVTVLTMLFLIFERSQS